MWINIPYINNKSCFSISVADLSATTFFKQPFKSLVLPKHLVEYTVMNIEPISENDRHRFSGQGTISKRVRTILLSVD